MLRAVKTRAHLDPTQWNDQQPERAILSWIGEGSRSAPVVTPRMEWGAWPGRPPRRGGALRLVSAEPGARLSPERAGNPELRKLYAYLDRPDADRRGLHSSDTLEYVR